MLVNTSAHYTGYADCITVNPAADKDTFLYLKQAAIFKRNEALRNKFDENAQAAKRG